MSSPNPNPNPTKHPDPTKANPNPNPNQERAHRQAKGLPPCPPSLQGRSEGWGPDEFDAARQMRELLQHAACWCPKPLAVSDVAPG